MLLFKDDAKYFKINNPILFSTTIKSKIYVYLCIIKIIKYVGNWFENVL